MNGADAAASIKVSTMSEDSEQAVAEFLRAGGRISKVQESVRVSEGELLEYLASCGVPAEHRAGDARPYLCRGKRMSLKTLVALANEFRRATKLPPFAARLVFPISASRQSKWTY